MTELPEYIHYAFEQLGDEDDHIAIEQFLARWGGTDHETLVRVLQEGQSEDRVLALFAIGYHTSSWAKELLFPFLGSTDPQERWASAICLGRMKQEEALPVLLSLITECLPPKEKPYYQGMHQGNNLWLFNMWRSDALLILAEWARAESVPNLSKALKIFCQLEQAVPPGYPGSYWRHCQGLVLYAFGWLKLFDTFNQLSEREGDVRAWRVYFVLGYLQAHKQYPDVLSSSPLSDYPQLLQRVVLVFKEDFHLSEDEQHFCLKRFAASKWS